jgi:putative RecB family exonuclease
MVASAHPSHPNLSYTLLSRFEQCPYSFRLHYKDELPSDPIPEVRFARCIRRVLERLLGWACFEKIPIEPSEAHADSLFRDAWSAEGLTGLGAFQEGVDLLHGFVRDCRHLDPKSVLALEQDFAVPVGAYNLIGTINRIDRADDETVEVIAYKTNRRLPTCEELDTSLQLSIYAVAAAQLFPWARSVRLTFWMLRQGIRLSTKRTPEQLDVARSYIQGLGDRINRGQDFPARLNPRCVHCDHRTQCAAYTEATTGEMPIPVGDPKDLKQVAVERQKLANVVKILTARKDVLDDVLRAELENRPAVDAGGVRYMLTNVARTEYPLQPTVTALLEATGIPRAELVERLGVVSKGALEDFIKGLASSLLKPNLLALKKKVEATATKSYSSRLCVHEVRS